MIKKLPPKVFKDIYSKVPRLCVELLIKNKNGILLTLRDIEPLKGYWHLPGGTVLFGETLLDTIKRVAKEELGVEASSDKLLGPINWINTPGCEGHTVSLVYLVEINSMEIKLDKQASKFGFFNWFPENIIKEHKDFIIQENLL